MLVMLCFIAILKTKGFPTDLLLGLLRLLGDVPQLLVKMI